MRRVDAFSDASSSSRRALSTREEEGGEEEEEEEEGVAVGEEGEGEGGRRFGGRPGRRLGGGGGGSGEAVEGGGEGSEGVGLVARSGRVEEAASDLAVEEDEEEVEEEDEEKDDEEEVDEEEGRGRGVTASVAPEGGVDMVMESQSDGCSVDAISGTHRTGCSAARLLLRRRAMSVDCVRHSRTGAEDVCSAQRGDGDG